MKFSQRIGKTPVKLAIQIESIDQDLRIALWNGLQIYFFDMVQNPWINQSRFNLFFKLLWKDFFKRPLDNLDNHYPTTYGRIREDFFKFKWFEVYDFVEYLAAAPSAPVDLDSFAQYVNSVLEQELAGYRLVDGLITPIADATQIDQVHDAIQTARALGLSGVESHLHRAIQLFSDRKTPDYRNTIKEAISAVESLAKLIAADPKADLAKALKALSANLDMHQGFRNGLLALYGYTSDEQGIRHALLDRNPVDADDARFMLVACSVLVHFLTTKAQKAGINLTP